VPDNFEAIPMYWLVTIICTVIIVGALALIANGAGAF
jgi:hypothetical protein